MIVVRLEVSFEISLTRFSRNLSFLACPLVFCDFLPFRMSTVNESIFAATIADDDAQMQPAAPALQPDAPATPQPVTLVQPAVGTTSADFVTIPSMR